MPEVTNSPSTLIELVGVVIQGVGLVVLVTIAWSLSAKIATLTTTLNFLTGIPAEMKSMQIKLSSVEKDLDNLWKTFREYVTHQEQEEQRQQERFEKALEAYERRAKNG